MIHELLQITGSHNVEGTLILPNDTGSAQTVTTRSSDSFKVHTFTSSATFTVSDPT